MLRYGNARWIPFVSFLAGLICLIFALLIQPGDPVGFLGAVVDFSQSIRSSALDAVSVFAFWVAVTMLGFGLMSCLFSALLKNRQRRNQVREARAQPDYADKGEDNWMFI